MDYLEIAKTYAQRPDDWPLAPRFDPLNRWYHKLAVGDGFEVWLLSWLPGQGTDLHDHGGCAGAFTLVSGILVEETPAPETGGRIRLAHEAYGPGQGRLFEPDHVHRITNTSRTPAVSVHAYGPALRSMTRYRIVNGALITATIEHAGVDW